MTVIGVSIHAPAWGATPADVRIVHGEAFQSTLPRGERRRRGRSRHAGRYVSIHAPAWGATVLFNRALEGEQVSIHAPAWGATAKANEKVIKINTFQSTLPRGERREQR